MLFKTGETVISDAKEVVSEDQNVRGYLLKNPQIVRTQEKAVLMESQTKNSNYELDVMLTPWMILSTDKEYVVSADYVATICEPLQSVREMFLNKIEPPTPLSETEVVNG